MLRKYSILIFSISLQSIVWCQSSPPEYRKLIKQADSLYNTKEYLSSGKKFSEAFQILGDKGYSSDRYNAACSWALAGESDSAFYLLDGIVYKSNYSEYEHFSKDPDLESLHSDKRWYSLLMQVKQNKETKEKSYNQALINRLDSLVVEDQKWRNLKTKYSNGEVKDTSITEKAIIANMLQTDSLMYYQLQTIFYQYGFPNYDLVGEKGSNNFWLLVQHQDHHPSFQDSVLAKMKLEIDSNRASSSNYAYLLDRVKVNTNQLQVYGTQMKLNKDSTSYEPNPLMDAENVNKRRLEMGLMPIENYIEVMNKRYFGSLKNN